MQGVLATPGIAIVLGLILGVILLSPLIWAFLRFDPVHMESAQAIVMGGVFGGLLFGLGVMALYYLAAKDSFVYFGVAVVVGFCIALGALSVVAVRRMNDKSSDDAQGR